MCFKCGEIIPSDSEYCPYCLVSQYVRCPKCGFRYLAQYPGCYKCGTNREQYIKQKEEERIKEEQRKKEEEEAERVKRVKEEMARREKEEIVRRKKEEEEAEQRRREEEARERRKKEAEEKDRQLREKWRIQSLPIFKEVKSYIDTFLIEVKEKKRLTTTEGEEFGAILCLWMFMSSLFFGVLVAVFPDSDPLGLLFLIAGIFSLIPTFVIRFIFGVEFYYWDPSIQLNQFEKYLVEYPPSNYVIRFICEQFIAKKCCLNDADNHLATFIKLNEQMVLDLQTGCRIVKNMAAAMRKNSDFYKLSIEEKQLELKRFLDNEVILRLPILFAINEIVSEQNYWTRLNCLEQENVEKEFCNVFITQLGYKNG